jgi:hypothetical protein
MTAEQMDCIAHYSEYFPVNSRFRLAALHQLLKQGDLELSANFDPSQPITRGEFYRLLARQLRGKDPSLSAAKSLEVLSKAGAGKFIASGDINVDEALQSPISSNEAFNLLAKLMDKNGNFGNFEQAIPVGKIASAKRPGKKLRADRWFVQPAFAAENRLNTPKGAKPMNYLDAAQLVLEASSGLK